MNPITLTALEIFPRQLQAHYQEFPQVFTNWAPASWEGIPSEQFTAIEQLCHIRDIEVEGYQVRFNRTLNEQHPMLESIDSEPLAKARAYSAQSADAVLASFGAARIQTIALLRRLSPEQWSRRAEFEGYGPLTLRSLAHYLCSHDQQHLAGLQWLLGKMEAMRA